MYWKINQHRIKISIYTATVIMGSIETTEAIKILLGVYDNTKSTSSNLIVYDTWNHSFDSINVKKNLKCECCSGENFEYLDSEEQEIITSLCGRNAIQITPADPKELSLKNIAQNLEKLGIVKCSDYMMLFKNDETEISLFLDGRAIIKGLTMKKSQDHYMRGTLEDENYQTKKGFNETGKGCSK